MSTSNVGLLAANQPDSARPRTYIPRETAAEMVRRMVAERITAKVIRLFSADSPFVPLKPERVQRDRLLLEPLPPAEVSGCRFSLPPGSRKTVLGLELIPHDQRVMA